MTTSSSAAGTTAGPSPAGCPTPTRGPTPAVASRSTCPRPPARPRGTARTGSGSTSGWASSARRTTTPSPARPRPTDSRAATATTRSAVAAAPTRSSPSAEAGSGDDLVLGGDGADLIGSYAGRDDLRGGPGNDFIEAYGAQPASARGDSGADQIAQAIARGSGMGSFGGAGRDVVSLYGDALEGSSPRARFTVDLRDGHHHRRPRVEPAGQDRQLRGVPLHRRRPLGLQRHSRGRPGLDDHRRRAPGLHLRRRRLGGRLRPRRHDQRGRGHRHGHGRQGQGRLQVRRARLLLRPGQEPSTSTRSPPSTSWVPVKRQALDGAGTGGGDRGLHLHRLDGGDGVAGRRPSRPPRPGG